MSLIVTESAGSGEKCPTGMQTAVCVRILDLGLQESPWGDKSQMMLIFELSDEVKSDGKTPFLIGKTYTKSLNTKANLYKDLISWRGREFTAEELKAFDVAKVLGKAGMLNIIDKISKKGSEYSMVSTISPVHKSITVKEATTEQFIFDIETDINDKEKLAKLPNYQVDIIKKSKSIKIAVETTEMPAEAAKEFETEDVPF